MVKRTRPTRASTAGPATANSARPELDTEFANRLRDRLGLEIAAHDVLAQGTVARLAAFAAEHLLELRRVARRYGPDAEDIVAQTMLKLTLALRNDPDRTLDIGYVRTALATTATDFAAKAALLAR